MVEKFIGILAGGGSKCLISGRLFPATTKAEKEAAHQQCRAHVAALCEAQDGGSFRAERTLDERRLQYAESQ